MLRNLCPHKVIPENGVVYCNDGFPDSDYHAPNPRVKCTAWVIPHCLPDLCRSGACNVTYNLPDGGGISHIEEQCETTGICPYSGCSLCKTIKPIPDELIALTNQYKITNGKKKASVVTE